MESDVGQYWFCVSSHRFRSSSRRMWDNIGFAFCLIATCVRLVASDCQVAECGQYWFCVLSRRYLCSSRRFRSSSCRMWDNIGFAFRHVTTCVRLVASDRRVAECGTILVLRFVSSLLVFVSSLQIVESPNVGQYWFCVSSCRFRSLSRQIGPVPMRLGSSRCSRIGSHRSLLFAVSFFWVSTYRPFSFILLALFFIFSYAFLSLSFQISWVHFSSCPVFRQFISHHRVTFIHMGQR